LQFKAKIEEPGHTSVYAPAARGRVEREGGLRLLANRLSARSAALDAKLSPSTRSAAFDAKPSPSTRSVALDARRRLPRVRPS
jgi:hypothetical protein